MKYAIEDVVNGNVYVYDQEDEGTMGADVCLALTALRTMSDSPSSSAHMSHIPNFISSSTKTTPSFIPFAWRIGLL